MESLQKNHATRNIQLEQISRCLGSRTSLLMGDFNVHDVEDKVVDFHLPQYHDIWKKINPGSPGYTYDSESNAMINRPNQARFDRILMKSLYWKENSVQMIGKEQLCLGCEGHGQNIHPSDHFGLVAMIEWIDHILSFKFGGDCQDLHFKFQ